MLHFKDETVIIRSMYKTDIKQFANAKDVHLILLVKPSSFGFQ